MTDWIEWNGAADAPVSDETVVEVRYRDEADPLKGVRNDTNGEAWMYAWWHDGEDDDIVAYRVVSHD